MARHSGDTRHVVQCLCALLLNLIVLLLCEVSEAKVFERCELAKVLRHKHALSLPDVAKWVCIAQHSSGFNTETHASGPDGSSHGLFQISDVYWCSPPGKGSGCNLPCARLRDADLTDDLQCTRRIVDAHQKISGDGYTAWNAYTQFCRFGVQSYIEGCFPRSDMEKTFKPAGTPNFLQVASTFKKQASNPFSSQSTYLSNFIPTSNHYGGLAKKRGKVYNRCELAQELYYKHKMPMEEIPTWVCIAEHESRFDTSAVGRRNADGSADHGIFQISDLFWCSKDQYGGKACGLQCNKLLDDDITDDVRCIRRIYGEHAAISGDGFTAWTVYNQHCRQQQYQQIATCFPQHQSITGVATTQLNSIVAHTISAHNQFSYLVTNPYTGKVYKRCELAQELYFIHKFPIQDIATWLCIIQHESNYDTAAVGRLNADGSADHGLFQISDLYWCSHDSLSGGKACNIPCQKLLDSDITDDVRCVKKIYEEHTRISGDGFTAWTVYNGNCRSQSIEQISSCFDKAEIEKGLKVQADKKSSSSSSIPPGTGKIYKQCELAQELYFKHKMPMDEIPTWVCIAQYESSFNTAAVGRLNTDGSADHGLFQISDLYWCSHDSYGGKACNIPCNKLLDTDITDDVRCIRTIYEEHTRISGDGFTAWTVYNQHCRQQRMDRIASCFNSTTLAKASTIQKTTYKPSVEVAPSGPRKVYKKCELAQELYFKHKMPMEEVPTWVCIAQHESSFSTAAVGRLNTDGSADHGLFQISDLYWCTHDSYGGKGCNVPCNNFLDSDITDDVRCIQIIYEEHTRISGDGFNAWTVYKPHCRQQRVERIADCFNSTTLAKSSEIQKTTHKPSVEVAPTGPRKIYKKCELAQELYFKHKMPMDEVPTWVCIAQHESSFNTAAIGRLNTDGSADHGLFQISDLYWCTHDSNGGKACNLPCNKLLDSDITDDVRCVRTIHEEHTRISGDGFNAWTVYKPHCRQQRVERIADCFNSTTLAKASEIPKISYQPSTEVAPSGSRKVYKKCELAQELYFKHKMPMEEVPTWVCIAQHESSFNTAAVGRLNTDGSADHGLFQISDLYWCTHDTNGGKACNIPCNKLLDSDISDDIRCVRTIYEEHTRISGDGFTAWTVYGPHCRNQQLEQVKSCFDSKVISMAGQTVNHNAKKTKNQPAPVTQANFGINPFLKKYTSNSQATTAKLTQQSTSLVAKPLSQNSASGTFSSNPFLNSLSGGVKQQGIKTQSKETGKISISNPAAADTENNYNNNPFLQKITTTTKIQTQKTEDIPPSEPAVAATQNNFQQNPFLQKVPTTHQPTTKNVLSSTFTKTTKKYVLSDSFRTTPKPTKSTISYTTTTATKKLTTTRKPTAWTTTTKKPTTNWKVSIAKTTTKTNPLKITTTQKPTYIQTTNHPSKIITTTTSKKSSTIWWTPHSSTTPKTKTTAKPTTTRATIQPPKLKTTITTKKPSTIWWTPSSTTTGKTTTTPKPTTTHNTIRPPKLKTTTTTKKPSTIWWTPSSTTTGKTTATPKPTTTRTTIQPLKQKTTTATKKPSTIWWTPSSTTTGKATTTPKPTTTRTTTQLQKLTTATTKKPTTNWKTSSSTATTTSKPTTAQTTTTNKPATTRTIATTTKKRSTNWRTSVTTATTPKTTTTRTKKTTTNWKTPSTKTTPITTTTQKPKTAQSTSSTTSKKPSTIWWIPSSTTTTTKPTLPKTTATTLNPRNARTTSTISKSTTTTTTMKKPTTNWKTPSSTTTTSNPTTFWKATNSKITTTTKKPTTTQKTTKRAKTASTKKLTTDWRTTQTTAKTTRKTATSMDWRTTKTTTATTKKPTTIQDWKTTKATKTTTRKPTTKLDWKTTTTTTKTDKSLSTTKKPRTTTNWRSTTLTPTATTNWQTTTKTPTITTNWLSTTTTTKKPTAKTTTRKLTTTTKPTTVTTTTQRSVPTTKTRTNIATSTTQNPFDHPYFKKYLEQVQSTTKTTTVKK